MIIKDNKTELYHSGIYLGKDYSEGIKHYKYVKKERRNGRWVYYYDNKDLKKAEENFNKAEDEIGLNRIKYVDLSNRLKNNTNNLIKADTARLKNDSFANNAYYNILKADRKVIDKEFANNFREEKDAYRKYNEASKKLVKEEIKHLTIGSLTKVMVGGLNAISYGKQKVGKALSKIGKLFKR